MKDWGVGVGVGGGGKGCTVSQSWAQALISFWAQGSFALKFWALGFGFEKFWLKDSCIPKFTYLKLLLMLLMGNLQFGFRVLVYQNFGVGYVTV